MCIYVCVYVARSVRVRMRVCVCVHGEMCAFAEHGYIIKYKIFARV